MRSSVKLTLAGMGLLLAWGTCVAPVQASDDTWTTTKVRIALLTTDGAGRDAVKVDTEHGKVTIHGTVDSEAVKEKAEATVRAVGGVTDVRNLIQVVKESSQKSVKAADKDVNEAVEKALKADKNFDGIKVKSVDRRARVPRRKHREPGPRASGHRDRLRRPRREAGGLRDRDRRSRRVARHSRAFPGVAQAHAAGPLSAGDEVDDRHEHGGADDRPQDREGLPAEVDHEGLRQLELVGDPRARSRSL